MKNRRIYGHVALVLWIVMFYLGIGFILWIIVDYFRVVGDMEEARVTSPEGLSGRPSNTQSNLESKAMTEIPDTSLNEQEISQESQKDCFTVEEIKQILVIKASQRRTK